MKNKLSLFTLLGMVLFSISSLGQPYCNSSYPNYFQNYISNINFNTISNPSGPTGYSDFTAQNTDISQGTQYILTAQIVNFNPNTMYIRAWIDWNQDYDFIDAGETYVFSNVLGPTFGTNVSVNILVPAGATLGATRMRISASRGFVPTPCNSGGYLYGETEDYSVTITSSPVFWDGDSDTQWNNPLNWSTDVVPTITDAVVIPGSVAQYPNFTGALYVGAAYGPNSCKTLIIQSGASVTVGGTGKISIFDIANIHAGGTLSSNTLTVGSGGALYNNGGTISTNEECVFSLNSSGSMSSGSISVGGLLEFRSTSSWSATGGTIYCKTGTNTEIINDAPGLFLNDLVINTGGTANLSGDSDEGISLLGSFTIQPNAEFTMDQPLTGGNVSAIVIGENLIVDGNISGNASFISEDGTTFLSYGTTTVNNYYADSRWHFISSPVSSAVSGVFSGLYLKEFIESSNSYTPAPGIVSTTHPLNAGKGFEMWSSIGNQLISYTGGQLNTGDISAIVTATDINSNLSIGDGEGWNLLGTPYPSAIDVGTENDPVAGYTWTNMDSTIYTWNGTSYSIFNMAGNGTGINGGTRYLPSMQGFFLKANDFSPAFTFSNSARVHSSQANYKSSKNDYPTIRMIVDGNGYADELLLRSITNATDQFDSKYDAYKLHGIDDVPSLYSMANESKLCLNTVSEFTADKVIPLYLKTGSTGIYTITSTMIDLYDSGLTVYLEDLFEETTILLEEGTTYEFVSEVDDDEYRFNLHFKNGNTPKDYSSAINIYSYEDLVVVQKEDGIPSDIFIYDILGREVMNETNNIEGKVELQVLDKTGYYVVKVISGGNLKTEKVFIK